MRPQIGPSLSALRRNQACRHLDPRLLASRNRRKTFLLFKPQSVVLRDNSPSKLLRGDAIFILVIQVRKLSLTLTLPGLSRQSQDDGGAEVGLGEFWKVPLLWASALLQPQRVSQPKHKPGSVSLPSFKASGRKS